MILFLILRWLIKIKNNINVIPIIKVHALKLSGRPLKAYTNKGDSGGKVIRMFCDQCGSSVLGEVETHPDVIFINAGTLDNPNTFEPEEEIWTQSKLAFSNISGKIESYPRASSG